MTEDENLHNSIWAAAKAIGVTQERERIITWIEENRSAIELEPGEVIYRDHFNSESLIALIKGENK